MIKLVTWYPKGSDQMTDSSTADQRTRETLLEHSSELSEITNWRYRRLNLVIVDEKGVEAVHMADHGPSANQPRRPKSNDLFMPTPS